jgi:hypothetical protein
MGWVKLAESLSASASARVGWTESNKHIKAKGKNPLAFFHFVNLPLTPLEVYVLLLTGLKGRKKNVDPVGEVS